MSSMHLSRVVSPVMEILTPSFLALRTSDLLFAVGGVPLLTGVVVADCLRGAGNSNRSNLVTQH